MLGAFVLCIVKAVILTLMLIIHSKLFQGHIPQTTEYCKCTLRYYLLTGSF